MKEYVINDFFCYKIFKIAKRTIYYPNRALLYYQKNVLKILQRFYPLSNSIEKCAKKHINQKWLLKMDIERFYESIPVEKILEVLNIISEKTALFTTNELKERTIVHNILPTGAPTSAHIANACMESIDKKIEKECKAQGIEYSRYMDDLFFSSSNKTDLKKIENFVRNLLLENKMQINDDKVKYVSQNKKQIIMGILVNKKKACLPKETKRKIRAVLHQYMSGKTNDENYVAGYLSYVFSVDKEYFKILNKNYCLYKKKYSIDSSKIRIIGKLFNHNLRKI